MLELTSSLMQSNGSTGGDFKPHRPALDQRCHGNYIEGGVPKRPLSAAARLNLLPFTSMQSQTVSFQKAKSCLLFPQCRREYNHDIMHSGTWHMQEQWERWLSRSLVTCEQQFDFVCFSQVYNKQVEHVTEQESACLAGVTWGVFQKASSVKTLECLNLRETLGFLVLVSYHGN